MRHNFLQSLTATVVAITSVMTWASPSMALRQEAAAQRGAGLEEDFKVALTTVPDAPANNSGVLPGGTLFRTPQAPQPVRRAATGLEEAAEALIFAQAKDFNRLKMLAHQLKGAAGGYGFPALTEAARKVEAAAATDPVSPADTTAQVRALADLAEQSKLAA